MQRALFTVFLSAILGLMAAPFCAAQSPAPSGMDVYRALQRFDLSGGSATVEGFELKRDRATMLFYGKFYFEAPVAGRVRGAVFLGQGTFRAELPPVDSERDYVRRMLKADKVESDFRTAVLRFSDDTFDRLGGKASPDTAPREALELAAEIQPRLLRETGANLSARLMLSILNHETPGVFLGQFDKGKRGRFTFLFDPQERIPVANFGINAGEKGLIFQNPNNLSGTDVWMAFYSLDDFEQKRVKYSDQEDLISIPHYAMKVDLRNPTKKIMVTAQMDMEVLKNGVTAIPLSLGESLSEYDSVRLKKALRVSAARLEDGSPLTAIQEDWEGGLTLLLPAPRAVGDKFGVTVSYAGDYMYDDSYLPDCYYPRNSTEWYPRHGHLKRSTFDLTFEHRDKFRAVSVGTRLREEKLAGSDSDMVTQWRIDQPIPFAVFGVGRFERYVEKVQKTGLPVEFNSMPSTMAAIKEDFMLAEMMNCLQFFSEMFGPYPYPAFGALFHPRGYGQGIATLLLLPKADRAAGHTYAFIAHETSHQWWGNIVAWRSYRDQWLSEGFAEYSGVMYTRLRDKSKAYMDLIKEMRRTLLYPPGTALGIGTGRVADIGPLTMGHRLGSRESTNGYQALVYSKGGLVLRMLHFLFTDPESGDGTPFSVMMKDFVSRHQGSAASSENFRDVANEHFVRTRIAQKYGLKDLDWFFREWVYQAHLPTYRMEYRIEDQPDGSVMLKGTLFQDRTPADWFMVLPVVISFGQNRQSRGTLHVAGPKTDFALRLPLRPEKVELDPELWILSEETSTKRMK